MLPLPPEFAGAHACAVNHLFGVPAAPLEATRRFSGMLSATGRDAIHHHSRHLSQLGHGQIATATQLPATIWLESGARNARLVDAAYALMSDAQHSLLQVAETQVRLFDAFVSAFAAQAAQRTPWESSLMLGILRSTFDAAEHTLHGVDTAATQSLAMAKNEVRNISQHLGESNPSKRPDSRGRKIS
jgi:hypothetical protein